MKKLNSSLALGAVLCALSSQAVAELRVVVTPTRSEQAPNITPNHVSVISSDDIESSGASTVLDVLANTGSIQVSDFYGDGSRASVDIRGFGATAGDNVLILVDGRELNNSDLSSPEWSSIPVQNIERIEVIQGSAGALYGDKAVGGVVNVILKDPQDFAASVKVGGGSYQRQLAEAQTQDSFENGLSYRVSGKLLETDNYRENNDLEYSNLYSRTGFNSELIKTYIELQRTDEDVLLPGGLTVAQAVVNPHQANPFSTGAFSNTETELVRWFGDFEVNDDLKASLSVSQEEAEGSFSFGGFGAVTYHSKREQAAIAPTIKGKHATKTGELIYTVGADLEEVEYVSGFGNTAKRDSEAFFAHVIVPLTERLSISAGSRTSEIEDSNVSAFSTLAVKDEANATELGVNFIANDAARIFARIDSNFRFANLDEINFIPASQNQLKVQEGESYELGGEFVLGDLDYTITFYHLALENEIAYDPTTPNVNSFSGFGANTNLDDTERDGVILEASYAINDKTTLFAGYSYVNAEFVEGANKGKKVAAVAEDNAKLAVKSSLMKNLSAYAEVLYTGNQFLQGDFSNSNEERASYAVVNANVNYLIDSVKLGLKINNVLDREYADVAISGFSGPSIYPSPARNFWLTAAYAF